MIFTITKGHGDTIVIILWHHLGCISLTFFTLSIEKNTRS